MNSFIIKGENFLKTCVESGLAQSYDVLEEKWVKPYPEVTGYVIKYFCDYYNEIDGRIISAANKLIQLQNHLFGGWVSFNINTQLYAFDTSQIVIGLCALYKKTGDSKYYEAAIKGGDFLISQQLGNGAIVPVMDLKKNEMIIDKEIYKIWNGPYKLAEGYNALYEISNNKIYLEKKLKLAEFYRRADDIEYTHPMGYFFEGLIAGGEFDLVKDKLIKKIIPRIESNGFISYTKDLPYAYVSGTIQLGIILFKMGFINEAKAIRDYGRQVQSKHKSGGLFQYANENGELNSTVHSQINSWGTKYYCELERMLANE